MPQMQPIKTGGTLVAAGQNQIQLSTNTNQTIYVMVGPNTSERHRHGGDKTI